MSHPPLDYRTVPQLPQGRPIFSIGAFVTLVTVAAVIMAASLMAQHFEQVFKDFHTDLPTTTILLLSFSRMMLTSFGWIPLLAGVLGIPFLWPLVVSPPADGLAGRNRRRRARLAIFIIVGLIVGFVAYSLFSPLIVIVQSVSDPKH